MTITAVDRATGAPLATLSGLTMSLPEGGDQWRFAKRVRPVFVKRGVLTSAQAACAFYRYDA